jgi:formamidopyrimidine-DNA glycosylase
MPELPEVETTRRGIRGHIEGKQVRSVAVRQRSLRWPVPASIGKRLQTQTLHKVERRGKYLLLTFDRGTLILHLGMSGNLRILPCDTPAQKHDHLDLCFDNNKMLRLHDPRRFGAALWTSEPVEQHELLHRLGPEPLSPAFTGAHLYELSRKRRCPVKNFIMDSHIVVGVGNIYASESLFLAGIHPARAAGRISGARYEQLAEAIRSVLSKAIKEGGTTLKDFVREDGRPGYFKQSLNVYGRAGLPCPRCGTAIKSSTIGQRSSYYCPQCQR